MGVLERGIIVGVVVNALGGFARVGAETDTMGVEEERIDILLGSSSRINSTFFARTSFPDPSSLSAARLRVCEAEVRRILRGVASSCLNKMELIFVVTASTCVMLLMITLSVVVAGVIDM